MQGGFEGVYVFVYISQVYIYNKHTRVARVYPGAQNQKIYFIFISKRDLIIYDYRTLLKKTFKKIGQQY